MTLHPDTNASTPTVHDNDTFARVDALFNVILAHSSHLQIPPRARELLGLAAAELADFGRHVALPRPVAIPDLESALAQLQADLATLMAEAESLPDLLRARATRDLVDEAASFL